MAIKSSSSLELVRLQRVFPLMAILLPGCVVFSSRMTLAPSSAALPAAIIPPAPAPTTMTGLVVTEYLCGGLSPYLRGGEKGVAFPFKIREVVFGCPHFLYPAVFQSKVIQ